MENQDKMIDWNDLTSLPDEEQVEIVNKLLEQSQMTVSQLSEKLTKSKSALSKHLSNLGYKHRKKKYVKEDEFEVYSNKDKDANNYNKQLELLKLTNRVSKSKHDKDLVEKQYSFKIKQDISDEFEKICMENTSLQKTDLLKAALLFFVENFKEQE